MDSTSSPQKQIDWKVMAQLIAHTCYDIEGSDPNQPEMLEKNVKSAAGTFQETTEYCVNQAIRETAERFRMEKIDYYLGNYNKDHVTWDDAVEEQNKLVDEVLEKTKVCA